MTTSTNRIRLLWRVLIALPIVAVAWIAILTAIMRLTGEAPAALVLFPPPGLIAALPPGAAITSVGRFSITLKGGNGLVSALYAAGAPLVLPAGLTACFPRYSRP
jgi:hypothetical protein